MKVLIFLFAALIVFISCNNKTDDSAVGVSEESIKRYISTLASDEFKGRKPFTEGETKTIAFLEEEIRRIGLHPGNAGSFTQDVPLVEISGHPDPKMILEGPQKIELTLGDDYVAFTQKPEETIMLDSSELVFCGYGIVAPEYNWNDYEGIDMKGKTALILVNDPGLGGDDSTFFKGSTMTYYGRWTYKYEEAARQGADAVMIIHETNMAGYPWPVVKGAGSGAKLNLEFLDYTPCKMQGWISLDAGKEIFSKAGLDLQTALQSARKPGFKAIDLPYFIQASIQNDIRKDVSKNVIAMIPGTKRPEEYILFSAHWDHLGIGTPVEGDSIYNGAVDNASGTAALLGIAEALMKGPKPERSIVFLWVTAEEQGLLGSAYYAAHPVFPPSKTVANLNIDGMHAFGPTRDLSIIGYGQSELEEYAERIAAEQGRYILPDQEPEKGYFFRSDHFSFARIGIPALYAKGSAEHRDKGKEYAVSQLDDYRVNRYHQPGDEYNEAYDVGGILQDANLYLLIARELANTEKWPQWKTGSEFKAIREKN